LSEAFCPNCNKTVWLEIEWLKLAIFAVIFLILFGWFGLVLIFLALLLYWIKKFPLGVERCPTCKMPSSEMKKSKI